MGRMTSHTSVENWRPVPEKPQYTVSDRGAVRSPSGTILKGSVLKSGHVQVDLGRGCRRYVHRLVLEAFVGQCPPGHMACHYDDDPGNDALENLRWDTRSGNSLDAVRNGQWHTANRTHCSQGHEYTPENTYVYQRKGGGTARFCRTCDRDRPRRGKRRI